MVDSMENFHTVLWWNSNVCNSVLSPTSLDSSYVTGYCSCLQGNSKLCICHIRDSLILICWQYGFWFSLFKKRFVCKSLYKVLILSHRGAQPWMEHSCQSLCPALQSLREHCRRWGVMKTVGAGEERGALKCCPQTWHGCCTNELKASVLPSTRSVS